jgi:NADPH:quinone reductase-like Zn-dependent oxidoreductase
MTRKMHAAVVEKFGKPLVLQERDIPVPGPGQILVKTEACAVCHTDLHAARGDWPLKPTLPFIPGHEGIGLVAAVGAGVTIVKEGHRVGVRGSIRLAVIANIASPPGRRFAPTPISVVIPGMADSPNIFSPIRTMSPTFRPALIPSRPPR